MVYQNLGAVDRRMGRTKTSQQQEEETSRDPRRRNRLLTPQSPAGSTVSAASLNPNANLAPTAPRATSTPNPAFGTQAPINQDFSYNPQGAAYQRGFEGNGYRAPTVNYAQIPGNQYGSTADFDFDRDYESQFQTLERARADAEQQYGLANQQDTEQLANYQRQLQQQQQEEFDRLAERMASNGILRSGVNVAQQGELGGQYQQMLDQFNQQRTAALTQRETEYANFQRQLQEQMGNMQTERTRRQQAAEEARARAAAEAAAAQRAAEAARNAVPNIITSPTPAPAAPPRQTLNVVTDNLGNSFVVDPAAMTRQSVTADQLAGLQSQYQINQVNNLAGMNALMGNNYSQQANSLASRLGGNLNNQASVDVRLGWQDQGAFVPPPPPRRR